MFTQLSATAEATARHAPCCTDTTAASATTALPAVIDGDGPGSIRAAYSASLYLPVFNTPDCAAIASAITSIEGVWLHEQVLPPSPQQQEPARPMPEPRCCNTSAWWYSFVNIALALAVRLNQIFMEISRLIVNVV